jgi:putative tryptophan/tyrosine transport system substrate-binding protein
MPWRKGSSPAWRVRGGNITGVSGLGLELHGKRLELLKEMVPQSARIAVLMNPASPYHASRMHDLTVAAQTLGVHLHVVELGHEDELASAFAALAQARVEALLVVEDALLLSRLRGRTVALAATHRLPAMYDRRQSVEAGGLMSYGRNLPENHRRAATYVDKILKGAAPADLPVEQPTTFELVINLKPAQALGLTIPPSLLFQADEVINNLSKNFDSLEHDIGTSQLEQREVRGQLLLETHQDFAKAV